MNNIGTISMGIKLPIIKEGDNLNQIILDTLQPIFDQHYLTDGDILGITESIVARAQGTYCTAEDIKNDIKQKYPNTDTIVLYEPIASRNRFAFILSTIAEIFPNIVIVWKNKKDEVGNDLYTQHPFTHIIYKDYYNLLVESKSSKLSILTDDSFDSDITLDCRCHVDKLKGKYGLQHICSDISEWGLLGSNFVSKRLKLFPNNSQTFCEHLQKQIKQQYNIHVDVLIYGDGCFKDPVGKIWEFADPITCPGSTISWSKVPQEVKLKDLAEQFSEQDVKTCIKQTNQHSQGLGTTPRRINDLLASLMDLTSGSGDKGTPMVLVKNYFNNYIM